jgi:sporulation protein YlmC with PRC-barrel domain
MADQLQLRGGTTTEHATFTGALREVTVDTDKDTVVVHDNATAGGHPLLREDLSNLPAGTIDNADISASAAIAYSKLAALTAGNVVLGNGSNVATSTAVTGDVTINSSGVTAIGSGVIVDADVSASAAIAGTKVAPDFGSQNLVTTGTATAASLNPTGSSVPTNGVYLPAANSVAISTNSVERVKLGTSEVVFNDGGNDIDFRIEGDTNSSLFFVDASADAVGIGTTSASSLLTLRSTAADNTAGISMQGASAGNITNLYNTLTDFVVQHAASEAFRVDSSRRLLIGTSSGNGTITSASSATASAASSVYAINTAATNTCSVAGIIRVDATDNTTGSGSYYLISCRNTTANEWRFIVYENGDVANKNNSYGALSDLKLKENIVDAGSQWDDFKQLQVRKYSLKSSPAETQIGLVAQEAEQVCPGLVYDIPDRDESGGDVGTTTKGIKYSVLYMKAVKALQEAMERIETLEAKVAALEAS